MVTIAATTRANGIWQIHLYAGGARVRPDRNGKVRGYRCTPGSSRVAGAISFRSMPEAAPFLRANPSWGARFSPHGTDSPQDIFVRGISIDGVPR